MEYTLTEAATKEDFASIAALADTIWHQTYDALIGPDQVNYMVEKFQSADAIEKDVTQNGYHYLMAKQGDTLLGYSGAKADGEGTAFLSKVYVDKQFQHQGIAKAMILFFVDFFREKGFQKMWLTVNKGNANAISAYERMGFYNSGSLVTDIGEGYVMDDYSMTLDL